MKVGLLVAAEAVLESELGDEEFVIDGGETGLTSLSGSRGEKREESAWADVGAAGEAAGTASQQQRPIIRSPARRDRAARLPLAPYRAGTGRAVAVG